MHTVVNEVRWGFKTCFRLWRGEKLLFWQTIVEAREVQPIKTTDELKEVLAKYLPERVRINTSSDLSSHSN
jgi:hypothetical protein